MRLTEHFTSEEMCRSARAEELGLDNKIPDKYISCALRVAIVLERIRAHWNKPLTVLSCYRSEEVNREVGGSSTSAHLKALAADFRIEGVPVIDICRWAIENVQQADQVIYEFGPNGWVHIGLVSVGTPRNQALTAVKEGGRTVYKPGIIEV
jgi:hypothetical protein